MAGISDRVRIRLTAQTWGSVPREQYLKSVALVVLWVNEWCMDPGEAVDLAVLQLRQMCCCGLLGCRKE